ncbi:hypothetical protein CRI70_18455 [Streptomyces sp. Ru87]|nr:hypothetical protein CRI70_18455 [Streptomyces sp. Ru87]
MVPAFPTSGPHPSDPLPASQPGSPPVPQSDPLRGSQSDPLPGAQSGSQSASLSGPPLDPPPDPPSGSRGSGRHAAALRHALAAAARGLPVIPLTSAKLPAVRSPHRPPHPGHRTAEPGHPSAEPGHPSAEPGQPSVEACPEPAGRQGIPAEPRGITAEPQPPSGRASGPQPPCRGECGRAGHGIHDATTDPAAVRRLFAAAPWATGYGIACGRSPHHLIGLDLDVKHGEDSGAALARLCGEHGFALPPTVTVRTPSGGRHLWYTGPPDVPVPNSAGRLARGLDIRGTGGYLVGPGSYTTRGVYRLAPGPAHPSPAPRALVRLLTAPARTAGARTAGGRGSGLPPSAGPDSALLAFVRASRPGERNARLFWAACRAYETGRGPALADALITAAVTTGLTAREARAAVLSAAHRQAGPVSPPRP